MLSTPQTRFIRWLASAVSISLLGLNLTLFSGCKKEEVGYYEAAPVETPAAQELPAVAEDAPLPPGHPPLTGQAPGMMGAPDMSSQTLSPDMVAKGEAPEWTLPEGWTETEPRPMRRANFAIGESGLELAVTSFPGDVGGLPANINRWRGQLGLPPVAESAMLPFVTEMLVDGQGVLLVDLLGPPQPEGAPTQRMLTAVTLYQGGSWFFKITGDASAIEQHRSAFIEFVKSLRFTAKSEVSSM